MFTTEQISRFWSKADSSNPRECWEWRAAVESTGYGRVKVNGFCWMAHRLAYRLSRGHLPDHMVVDHICWNRRCVNPVHLQLLTREANAVRHRASCKCPVCAPSLRPILTECKRGHDLTLEDARRKDGRCRLCARSHSRRYMAKVRARARA